MIDDSRKTGREDSGEPGELDSTPPTFLEWWDNTRPTKETTLWACIATAVVTAAIGFSWGGWVSQQTAQKMAASAAAEAKTALIASACVERFAASQSFASDLAMLKKKASFQEQGDFVARGGWVSFAGYKEPVNAAATACAARLNQMPFPGEKTASTGS